MSVLISALHQTSPERVTVALDDGSEIKATLGVIAELRLYVGRELEAAELQMLRASAALALCKNRGLELLSYRPMSAKELRDKLVQKGEDADTAGACVHWLEDQGILDDTAYAAMVARHYAGKSYGEGRVRQELRRRGIARELWDDAIGQMPESNSKLDRYIASRLKDPHDRGQIQKISAALFRRGYSWEEIREALRRFETEIPEE